MVRGPADRVPAALAPVRAALRVAQVIPAVPASQVRECPVQAMAVAFPADRAAAVALEAAPAAVRVVREVPEGPVAPAAVRAAVRVVREVPVGPVAPAAVPVVRAVPVAVRVVPAAAAAVPVARAGPAVVRAARVAALAVLVGPAARVAVPVAVRVLPATVRVAPVAVLAAPAVVRVVPAAGPATRMFPPRQGRTVKAAPRTVRRWRSPIPVLVRIRPRVRDPFPRRRVIEADRPETTPPLPSQRTHRESLATC